MMKKQWKNPALEILMRVFYGIALISGAVLMKGEQSCVFAIAHKIGVALFVVLFIQKTVSIVK